MAWETVFLKVPVLAHSAFGHKHNLACPKCEGKLHSDSGEEPEDELALLVLCCDRCNRQIAFDGCSGECAEMARPQCEECGKYYCTHCGIVEDFEEYGKLVTLRFCNDHIPEWYRNR